MFSFRSKLNRICVFVCACLSCIWKKENLNEIFMKLFCRLSRNRPHIGHRVSLIFFHLLRFSHKYFPIHLRHVRSSNKHFWLIHIGWGECGSVYAANLCEPSKCSATRFTLIVKPFDFRHENNYYYFHLIMFSLALPLRFPDLLHEWKYFGVYLFLFGVVSLVVGTSAATAVR